MRELGQYLGATREAKDKKKGRSSRDAGRHGKGEDKAAVMAKLRAERQAREASERARVQAIMGGGPPPEARRVSEVSEDSATMKPMPATVHRVTLLISVQVQLLSRNPPAP